MRFIALFPLALVFTFFSSVLSGQTDKIWTLEECIQYALEHNINIQKQGLGIDYQEEVFRQSRLGTLPNVNGYASHGYNWGRRIDPFTNVFATDRVRSNNLYLQGDLNLFSGRQQMNQIRQNKINLKRAQYDSDYYKDEVSITIATEYLQTLYYIEFVDIVTNQLEITNLQVNRTRKLVEAGTLAKGDLLIIEAQQASEELSLVQAENNLSLSYLSLSQLLELPSPRGFFIDKPVLGLIEQPEIFTPEQIFDVAIGNRPEIKSAEMGLESSVAALDIARGAYYPTLLLSGSLGSGYSGLNRVGIDPVYTDVRIGYTDGGDNVYSTMISSYGSYETRPFNDQLNDNLNETVGLSLRIPVFNGWRTRTQVSQAKIGIENANLDLQLQKNNLYKIWNRMSFGSYFPPPVKAVEIPKKTGGKRVLGVPTVADRVAQMVAKIYFEPAVEPHFHPDSYGYRPGKSAHDALAVIRKRCWEYDWVVEFDIKGLFDNIDHELLMKAVRKHTDNPWVILYIQRWLKAPFQKPDGTITERSKGTPQGGVISPVLANLFLHYAFDVWMTREQPDKPFARYADDGIAHCSNL
ncbi:MAG: TolC family protein, partial [Bacteroidales bacterium]